MNISDWFEYILLGLVSIWSWACFHIIGRCLPCIADASPMVRRQTLLIETLLFRHLRCNGDIITASGKYNHVLVSRSLRCFPGIADGFKLYGNTHLRWIGKHLPILWKHAYSYIETSPKAQKQKNLGTLRLKEKLGILMKRECIQFGLQLSGSWQKRHEICLSMLVLKCA